MKDTRHRTRLGSLFRFAARGLGLLGVLAAAVGAVITAVEVPAAFAVRSYDQLEPTVRPLLEGASGVLPQVGAWLLAAGVGVVLLWLLVELLGGLALVTGRKSAAGAGTAIQVGLAVALLVVVNAVSFRYYLRSDQTRDKRFTLAPELVEKLRKLDPNSPTTVVVLQMDKTSALEPERSDALTTAAQQKITEKVLDLVDELRELGPRFDVRVLKTKDEDYEAQRDAATAGKPELRTALDAAPENSIFFAANGRVRRLGFNQFYMLDKTASRGKPDLTGEPIRAAANLVLAPQGAAAFVDTVLAVEQTTPKVGVLTVHPLLTTKQTSDLYSSPGLRAALEKNGFEVVDVLLRRWQRGRSSPAADSYAEKELESSEKLTAAAAAQVQRFDDTARAFRNLQQFVREAPLADVNRRLARNLPRPLRDEEDRKSVLESLSEQEKGLLDLRDRQREELTEIEAKYQSLVKDDRAVENLRNPDLKAKLTRYTAECDLLVVPRLTVSDLLIPDAWVPAWLHSMNADQAEVVKAFVAAGKPVLFLLGPTTADPPVEPGYDPTPDGAEKLLQRFGIELGSTAVVFDKEVKAAAQAVGRLSEQPDPTPLRFPDPPAGKKPNPIAAAFLTSARSVDGALAVARSGGYRVVTVTPSTAARLPFAAEVLATTEKSWNESSLQPDAPPSFDPPPPDDPKRGTRDEERLGPFPVGVAVEAPVPAEWLKPTAAGTYVAAVLAAGPLPIGLPPGVAEAALTPDQFTTDDAKRPTVRVAAFGSGGLFSGKELDVGREALLLHTVNWLMKRDDALPRETVEDAKWRYPRVPLDDKQRTYWSAGAAVGLPLLAAFLGLIALMVRRLR
jgi:hypothetical protein